MYQKYAAILPYISAGAGRRGRIPDVVLSRFIDGAILAAVEIYGTWSIYLSLSTKDIMAEKTPCSACGALILPSTAEKNDGLCMPCKNGTRKTIEKSKQWYAKERELDKTCPFRALWRELVHKVYEEPQGFSGFTEDEKLYFAVGVLLGEVYNGGFVQFFDNTSGEYYRYAELGLIQMGAVHSLALLRQAKSTLFAEAAVPKSQVQRWAVMQNSDEADIEQIDSAFYKDPDGMDKRTEAFAVSRGLVKGA